MRRLWTHIMTFGTYDRTALYEHGARSGKYYIKTVSNYSGDTIDRYPSRAYEERHALGLNKGSRIRTTHRA